MGNISEIIGQEHIKEHIKSSIRTGKISHAYMICGEVASGKEFIANAFANALVCENLSDECESCGKCHACIQFQTKNHPDIITVTHQKPNLVSVEDIREQIIADVSIKPYSSRWKVYILNEAEKMTTQAQNALLKTLEEPPEYVVIMLLTTNTQMMLSTIISRCISLNLRPVEDKTLRSYLMKEIKIPDYQADICVAFARGNVGKAKSLAVSEEFDAIKNESLRVLKYINNMDVSDIIETLKKLTEYKLSVDDFLDIMMVWYRDVLMYKATMDADVLVFKEEGEFIRKRAGLSAYDGIEEIINAIEKTKVRLNANVNFELAMELLLLTIKEN